MQPALDPKTLEARLQQNLRSGTLTITVIGPEPVSQFGGTLAVGALNLSITGTLVDDDSWQLTLSSPVAEQIGILDLTALVADPGELTYLPEDGNEFIQLSVTQFSL